jgi:ribosomal protein S18 acetylase RimI-like enzyme
MKRSTLKEIMFIKYKINAPVSTEQFIALLNKSTLGKRRPVEDYDCMEGMIKNSNLKITAWDGEKMVGIARSMTDFNFACYLSDLAVDIKYQNKGMGKMLLKLTQEQLGPNCTLILISAPAANTYYEHLGFTNNQRCWTLEREKNITG